MERQEPVGLICFPAENPSRHLEQEQQENIPHLCSLPLLPHPRAHRLLVAHQHLERFCFRFLRSRHCRHLFEK
jgi:hypothetical protein